MYARFREVLQARALKQILGHMAPQEYDDEDIDRLAISAIWFYKWLGWFIAYDAGCFSIDRYNTKEEMDLTNSKRYCIGNHGPIHKHGDKYYARIYVDHEYIAVNINDPSDVKNDAGLDGACFGWAFINGDEEFLWREILNRAVGDIEAPENVFKAA